MKSTAFVLIIVCTMLAPAYGLERFEIVTTQELKLSLEDRAAGKTDFTLVNTLDTLIFEHHSIPGSVNLPLGLISQASAILGPQKNRMIITYWMGYRWVFAYKTAVAVKKHGYTNIRIYNGGIKDWAKNGFPLESIFPLPETEVTFMQADQLLSLIEAADTRQCINNYEAPLLTILDFRSENFLSANKPTPRIPTHCNTVLLQLDELRKPEIRRQIPRHGQVVTITETGNRDVFAIRYLSAFGFTNIQGLEFGMRGWLKLRYPIEKVEEP